MLHAGLSPADVVLELAAPALLQLRLGIERALDGALFDGSAGAGGLVVIELGGDVHQLRGARAVAQRLVQLGLQPPEQFLLAVSDLIALGRFRRDLIGISLLGDAKRLAPLGLVLRRRAFAWDADAPALAELLLSLAPRLAH